MRPAGATPLGLIRSLAYFLPTIEEVLDLRVSPDYFEYLRYCSHASGPRNRLAPGACAIRAWRADDGTAIKANAVRRCDKRHRQISPELEF
jgi:hypothetical protein